MNLIYKFFLFWGVLVICLLSFTIPIYIVLKNQAQNNIDDLIILKIDDIKTNLEGSLNATYYLMNQLRNNWITLPQYYYFDTPDIFQEFYSDVLFNFNGSISIYYKVPQSEFDTYNKNISEQYNRNITIFDFVPNQNPPFVPYNKTDLDVYFPITYYASVFNPTNNLIGLYNKNRFDIPYNMSFNSGKIELSNIFISSIGIPIVLLIDNIPENFNDNNTSKGAIGNTLNLNKYFIESISRNSIQDITQIYLYETVTQQELGNFDSNLQSTNRTIQPDINVTLDLPERMNINIIVYIEYNNDLHGFQTYYIMLIIFFILLIFSSIYLYLSYLNINQISAKELVLQNNQFISYIFHELRVPINSIELYINILNRDEINQYTLRALESIKQINKILDDVLSLNKIKSGKFVLSLDYSHIHTTINNLVDTNIMNTDFNVYIDDFFNDHSLYIDQIRINQVISNFISNAMKFSNGNPIDISLKKILDYRLKDEYYVDLKFSVKDNGIGISEIDKCKIFKPYQYIDNKTREKSIGLGLSICKYIIDLHNGEIGFESELGRGSEFYFKLTCKYKYRLLNESDKTIELNIINKNILIVDDNENNCIFLEKILSDQNECRVLNNGESAVKYLENNKVDLLLLDNNMPRMTGIETARKIREFNKEIIIVIITGDQSLVGRKIVGINNIIIKPVNITKLNKIKKFLNDESHIIEFDR